MPTRSLNRLLAQLEASKSCFGSGETARVAAVLDALSVFRMHDPASLIRFHEGLLFLRAFPQSKALVPRIERLLDTFHERVRQLPPTSDMSAFDDFETSGIAGTSMTDTLSFDVARWVVRRHPEQVDVDWESYDEERALGTILPRLIPVLREDADVEANIPWMEWIDAARGRESPLRWLIGRFERLPVGDRERAQLYDALRLPIRWKLENGKFSRTRNWRRPRKLFVHREPLIARSQVSLAQELSKALPELRKLPRPQGEAVMHTIRDVMLVRYRELYGTTLGDAASVVSADVGRGVVIHLWNLPPERRLPLRAYVAGFTLKNGVPINYIEAIGLCEWIEVGFNTFYTYRQGETAWIYAQALRCLTAFTGATTISIYPYQIGQNNDEAIDSGAFWFYRKLGFRPGRRDLAVLAEREEKRIAANPGYKTPLRTLRRFAEAHMFFEIPRS